MHLPRSAELARLVVLDEAGSTNDELAAMAAGADDFTTVLTLNQTAGRGRLGRVWSAPPGKTLAVSVLLRPVTPTGAPLALDHFGWFPLIAGAAMATAVSSIVPDRVTSLKWPNDVQIGGRKVSGLLAELMPGGDAVVLGAGLNLALGAEELPVPTATSLRIEGASVEGDDLVDLALSAYLGTLRELSRAFLEGGGDAGGSGILELVSGWCGTLGQEVRVQLPGGADLVGVATGIDDSGRLLVRDRTDGAVQAVAAGDVTHLRYE
jgi:BirA family biotin operon repressor/biotin-[acetyl-CoA-carboxylase] ligase